MKLIAKTALTLSLLAATFLANAADPGLESHLPSQAAADVLRDFTGADCALLASGLVKENYQADNLASLLQFPTDEVVVVSLKGKEIKQALERSLSLYPQSNISFLQLSGLEVTFSKSGAPNQRVLSVLIGGNKLDESKSYNVAMPASLGRGGLGYFKIWDKDRITKTFPTTTEEVLKGKRYVETAPRWSAQS